MKYTQRKEQARNKIQGLDKRIERGGNFIK